MVAGCGNNIMKICLIVFNILFVILGIVAIILGAIALADKDKLSVLTEVGDVGEYNVPNLLRSGAVVLIVAGAAILIIGGLGLFGACKESSCLLGTYGAVVVLIFILEVISIILAAVFFSKFEEKATDYLVKRLEDQYMGNDRNDVFTVAINNFQVKFQCCGINNSSDYANTPKWNRSSTVKVPETCCELSNPDAYLDGADATLKQPLCPQTLNGVHTKGCFDSIKSYAKSNSAKVIGIAAAIMAMEVICFIFAFCLCRASSDKAV